MAQPITYTSSVLSNGIDGTGSSYQSVYRSKQAPPFDLPTTYRKWQGYTILAELVGLQTGYGQMANMASTKGPWQLAWGPDVNSRLASYLTASRNSAYEKFRDEVKDTADFATTLVQRQQTLDMITNRALQLVKFTSAVIRRNPRAAARALGVKQRTPRGSLKDGGSLWLEYSYGWKPLIGDIGTGIEVLQSPYDPRSVRASGRREDIDYRWTNFSGTSSSGSSWGSVIQGYAQTHCSAKVRLSNPSLYLANSLGFVNPASVAWELVPFSFIVDWFVPVSSFLNQFTDWAGLHFDDASYFEIIATPSWKSEYRSWTTINGNKRLYGYNLSSTGIFCRRTLGIPSVTLVPRRVTGLHPARAANAVALLLQGLKSV